MWEKIFSILLISSIKFIFAFPLAASFKFNFITTFIVTSTGGMMGIVFFFFLWDLVIKLYLWFIHSYLYKFPKIRNYLKQLKNKLTPKKSNNTSFRKKKRYVWLKKNAGLLGITFFTPVLLSIPLGTFLAVRFYGRNFKTILFLSVTLIFWALILSCTVCLIGIKY